LPTFKKLSSAEIADLTRRRTNVEDLEEYLTYLKALKPGDWGSIELGHDDVQRVVKRRTSIAASSQGKAIRWRPGRNSETHRLFFQVQAPRH
jgi:hypothetical protein